MEETVRCQRQCVAKELEIQIGRSIELQLSDIFARQPSFSRCIVVECFSLGFAELCTNTQIVLII